MREFFDPNGKKIPAKQAPENTYEELAANLEKVNLSTAFPGRFGQMAESFRALGELRDGEDDNIRPQFLEKLQKDAKAYLDREDPKNDPSGLSAYDKARVKVARQIMAYARAEADTIEAAGSEKYDLGELQEFKSSCLYAANSMNEKRATYSNELRDSDAVSFTKTIQAMKKVYQQYPEGSEMRQQFKDALADGGEIARYVDALKKSYGLETWVGDDPFTVRGMSLSGKKEKVTPFAAFDDVCKSLGVPVPGPEKKAETAVKNAEAPKAPKAEAPKADPFDTLNQKLADDFEEFREGFIAVGKDELVFCKATGEVIDEAEARRQMEEEKLPVFVSARDNAPEADDTNYPVLVFPDQNGYALGINAQAAFKASVSKDTEPAAPEALGFWAGIWNAICSVIGGDALRTGSMIYHNREQAQYEAAMGRYQERRALGANDVSPKGAIAQLAYTPKHAKTVEKAKQAERAAEARSDALGKKSDSAALTTDEQFAMTGLDGKTQKHLRILLDTAKERRAALPGQLKAAQHPNGVKDAQPLEDGAVREFAAKAITYHTTAKTLVDEISQMVHEQGKTQISEHLLNLACIGVEGTEAEIKEQIGKKLDSEIDHLKDDPKMKACKLETRDIRAMIHTADMPNGRKKLNDVASKLSPASEKNAPETGHSLVNEKNLSSKKETMESPSLGALTKDK